jgi:phosphate transport system protein
MNEMTDGHIVSSYNKDLNQLHQLVIQIKDLACKQVQEATQSLVDEDVVAAQRVIVSDREIDALDIKADEEILRLIAKRQPMARDLREIMTIAKIVGDLERIGDQARRLARLTIRFYEGDAPPPNHQLLQDLIRMAAFVNDMVEDAVMAFDELDLDRALDVIRRDGVVSDDFRSALRRLSTFIMEDARSVGHMVDVVLGLRGLERIGGHAKNISRYVVFLVKGKDVRHKDLEAVEAEIAASLR